MWIAKWKGQMNKMIGERVKITTAFLKAFSMVKILAWEDEFIKEITQVCF
jgi:hypothetical protein